MSGPLDMFGPRRDDWAYSNELNQPNPCFSVAEAEAQLRRLRHLVRLAERLGYRFDEEHGPTPQSEIRELESRLFIGPRKPTPIRPPSALEERLMERAFSSSPMLQALRGKL